MTVLVASASKHGATHELAQAIGAVIEARGVSVDVKQMEDVDTVLPYDAFVLGSAIYMGKWLRSARTFLDEHAEVLALRPTWLFSSGPIGSPPLPAAGESFDVTGLVGTTHAREHQLFGGKLEKRELGLAERVMASTLHVPDGDYREWHAVTAWATTIARALQSEVAV